MSLFFECVLFVGFITVPRAPAAVVRSFTAHLPNVPPAENRDLEEDRDAEDGHEGPAEVTEGHGFYGSRASEIGEKGRVEEGVRERRE